MDERGSLPFSFFVSLLHEISQIPPRTSRNLATDSHPALRILNRWIFELQRRYSPLPSGTTATVLLLLFPEEDSRRKYDMQETRLARELANCFGVSMKGRGESLRRWKSETNLGCLGGEVKKLLDEASSDVDKQTSPLSIAKVDALLDELASTSVFSDPSLRKLRSTTPRTRHAILCDLYRSMSALDASFLTQIILKDLRPLLFPLTETHYTAALTKYNTKSVAPLSKEDVMKAWDPSGRILKIYKVRADLREAVNAYELGSSNQLFTTSPQPQSGIPIEIPKSIKGRGCLDALEHFTNSHKLWAETKYDGERAQIHVEVREDGSPHITIWSKSNRNSTLDRYGIHGIIRDALGLTKDANAGENLRGKTIKNVILDAEMVAYSNLHNKIDEFWRIRSLIAKSAYGARGDLFSSAHAHAESHEEPFSQTSLMSDASASGTRHLALVFFDLLVLNSVSLLSTSYSSRRAILESLIQTKPSYIMLAERSPITLNGPQNIDGAGNQLRAVWARVIANSEEGLVLKADEGVYNDHRSPWVKLKKDYIPGYGDTVDLVIIAASWDKNRARELRVTPTAYTTFYVGALANADTLKINPSTRPHFEIFFTVSYGLSREQLEEANFLIKNSDPLHYDSTKKVPKSLPYTFNLYTGLPSPVVLFQEPLLVELCGAGFTKAPQSKYYELRFPRLIKIYRASSRPWSDGVNLQDLHKIALQSIGRDRSTKDVDDWTKEAWGNKASPGIRCEKKRKQQEDAWVDKLAKVDGAGKIKRDKKLKVFHSSPCYSPRRDKHMEPSGIGRLILGVRPLEPILNLADSFPTHRPSNPVGILSRRTVQKSIFVESTVTPLRRRLEEPELTAQLPFSTISQRTVGHGALIVEVDRQKPTFGDLTQPVSFWTPPACRTKTRVPIPSSADSSRNAYASKPIVEFVQDALIWFAQPCNTPHASWRPPTKILLAGATRVHSLESLLAGCGWLAKSKAPTRMKYGVAFIDESTSHGNSWKEYALKMLKERQGSLAPDTRRKRIWVFDTKLLGFDALETTEGDVERLAVWRSD